MLTEGESLPAVVRAHARFVRPFPSGTAGAILDRFVGKFAPRSSGNAAFAMPPLASIELQVGKFIRQCVSAVAGLAFATAVAAGGDVTLAWDPVVHPLLSGYAVYMGSAPGRYDVRYEVGDVTSYQLVGLEEGRRYHFAVTAYAVLYGESEFSNDVGTTIPYRAPVVDFSASATMGTAPLALNFVATVQGTATSYLWSFGDGSTSTAPSPVHVYEAPGVYSVSLAVTGPGGTATSTRIGYVTVAPAGAASGGMLAGGSTPMPALVDLTSAGTIDWVHWRGNVRKAGVVPQISGLTLVGRGAVATPTTEPGALRWSDGVPVAAGSVSEGVSVSGTGRGFKVTAPADRTPRRLTLFVGAANASGRLVAHLSDSSASEFANMPVRKVGSRWSGVYTLTYHAASPGQTLVVEWIQARGISSPGKPAPGVSIQGAALSLAP